MFSYWMCFAFLPSCRMIHWNTFISLFFASAAREVSELNRRESCTEGRWSFALTAENCGALVYAQQYMGDALRRRAASSRELSPSFPSLFSASLHDGMKKSLQEQG